MAKKKMQHTYSVEDIQVDAPADAGSIDNAEEEEEVES